MPFHDLETEVFLSGEELFRHHLEDKKYNIILLDIELPSVNGIETAITRYPKEMELPGYPLHSPFSFYTGNKSFPFIAGNIRRQ